MSDDICECPKCGRQHRNLGFGNPPKSIMEQIAHDIRSGTFPKKSESLDEDLGDVSKHGTNCGWYESYGESGCTCSLKWRMALKTERQMHRAWRKRAEEAEAKLTVLAREPRTAVGSLD